MLAVHIEGPPKCLFEILFSCQCPFTAYTNLNQCFIKFYSLGKVARIFVWKLLLEIKEKTIWAETKICGFHTNFSSLNKLKYKNERLKMDPIIR
jgi:hypothetical protein